MTDVISHERQKIIDFMINDCLMQSSESNTIEWVRSLFALWKGIRVFSTPEEEASITKLFDVADGGEDGEITLYTKNEDVESVYDTKILDQLDFKIMKICKRLGFLSKQTKEYFLERGDC